MSLTSLLRLVAGLGVMIGVGPHLRAADPVPAPFLGVPFSVPCRIEAEFWDRGGEGAGYHFSGRPITNLFWRFPESQGRPGEKMVAAAGSYTNAVLQTGEWLSYTIECVQEGYYSILLKTEGPPLFRIHEPGMSSDDCLWRQGAALLYVDVDGERFSSPHPVGRTMSLPRVWLTRGTHRIRLVAGDITDTTSLQRCEFYPQKGVWEFFCVSVDWLEVIPAPIPMARRLVAGSSSLGFRDGPGPEARLGGFAYFLGERSSGEVLFLDAAVAAVRVLHRDGAVSTLAGYPGNPVQDGRGSAAGFGQMVDATWTPDERVLVLEDAGAGVARIRSVSPSGEVTTLFSGRAVVALEDIRHGSEQSNPPRITNRVAPLSRIVLTPEGEVRAVASFEDLLYTIGPGPWQPPIWKPYTRHVWFRIADGSAEALMISGEDEFLNGGSGPIPPPVRRSDLGDGVRYDGIYFGQLITENPKDFIHELLPGTLVFTALRTQNGTLYAAIEPGVIHGLDPDRSQIRLTVSSNGPGRVSGVPEGYVTIGQEIELTAIPTGLFSVFEGWSDGFSKPSRSIRVERDLWLNAKFVTRPPEPSGIIPGTARSLNNHRIQFSVTGILDSQFYRLEQSDNLRDWRPVRGTVLLPQGGIFSAGDFSVHSAEAPVVVNVQDVTRWYRVTRLDR